MKTIAGLLIGILFTSSLLAAPILVETVEGDVVRVHPDKLRDAYVASLKVELGQSVSQVFLNDDGTTTLTVPRFMHGGKYYFLGARERQDREYHLVEQTLQGFCVLKGFSKQVSHNIGFSRHIAIELTSTGTARAPYFYPNAVSELTCQ